MSKTKQFKTKEALRSSCLSKALADWIDTYSDKEIHRFYEAMDNYAEAYASQLHPSPTPPVEDGKQGGDMSAEDVLADIISIRNKLYEDLPTGEMNAFELLQTIKWHINELDNYCTTLSTYKSQPSTPVQDGKQVGDVVNSIVRIMLDSEMIGYDENMKPQSRQGHLNRTQYRSVAEKIAALKSITWK